MTSKRGSRKVKTTSPLLREENKARQNNAMMRTSSAHRGMFNAALSMPLAACLNPTAIATAAEALPQTAVFPASASGLRWSTKNGSWFKMDNLVLFVVTWVFLLVRHKPRCLLTPPIKTKKKADDITLRSGIFFVFAEPLSLLTVCPNRSPLPFQRPPSSTAAGPRRPKLFRPWCRAAPPRRSK